MSTSDIELINLSKNYGITPIVREIDLVVPQGEFVSILGPSGGGKTTTLKTGFRPKSEKWVWSSRTMPSSPT
jgi:ABC-type Fe3+/spermidine/putrescine transport system ATPase subunit